MLTKRDMTVEKRVHIKSITNEEYLDTYPDTFPDLIDRDNKECLISKGTVTTLICKEIAPDFELTEAHNICKTLNTETSHIWKTEDI